MIGRHCFEAEFRDAQGFGWDHGGSMPEFSWEKLISAKTDEIERLNGIYGRILDNAGVEKLEGSGKVISPHEVAGRGGKLSIIYTHTPPVHFELIRSLRSKAMRGFTTEVCS